MEPESVTSAMVSLGAIVMERKMRLARLDLAASRSTHAGRGIQSSRFGIMDGHVTWTRKRPASEKTRGAVELELVAYIVALGGTVHAQGMYSVLILYTL